MSPSYRYTFHRNYPDLTIPFMDQQQDEEEDLDQESRDLPSKCQENKFKCPIWSDLADSVYNANALTFNPSLH